MNPSPAPSLAPPPTARLLICGFGSFPGFPDNPAAAVVEHLREADWAPAAVRIDYRQIPTTWADGFRHAAQAVTETSPQGVLILGVAGGAERFRVETQARNHAAVDKPDAAGTCLGQDRISPLGPPFVYVTAPVEAMIAAIARESLPVRVSDDAGDYLCNQVLYRLLTEVTGPSIGFLHLPPLLSLGALACGTKAAATAFGLNLSAAAALEMQE